MKSVLIDRRKIDDCKKIMEEKKIFSEQYKEIYNRICTDNPVKILTK